MKSFNKYIVVVLTSFIVSCTLVRDYKFDSTANPLSNLTMMEYLRSQKDTSISMYLQAVEYTDFSKYMTGADLKTFIIPNNDAFRALLRDANCEKVSDIDRNLITALLKYTILPGNYLSYKMEADAINKVITESGDRIYISRIPTEKDKYPVILNEVPSDDPTYGGARSVVVQQDMLFKDNVAHIVSLFPVFRLIVKSPDIYTVQSDNRVTLQTAGDTHTYAGTSASQVYWNSVVQCNYRSNDQLRTPYIVFENRDVNFEIDKATLNFWVVQNTSTSPVVSDMRIWDVSPFWGNRDVKTLTKSFSPSSSNTIGFARSFEEKAWNSCDITYFIRDYYANPDRPKLVLSMRPTQFHTAGSLQLGWLHEDIPENSVNPAYITIHAVVESEMWIENNEPLVCNRNSFVTLTKEVLMAKGPDSAPDADPALVPVYSDNNIFFTLLESPTEGVLTRNGLPLSKGLRFTQAELDAGVVKYYHSDKSLSDKLQLKVTDYSGGTIFDPVTVNITII